MAPTETIGMRGARASFGSVVDRVAGETAYVPICRRAKPLAALIPTGHLDRFRELERRAKELAAVLRGRGFEVQPWATPNVLEVVATLGAKW